VSGATAAEADVAGAGCSSAAVVAESVGVVGVVAGLVETAIEAIFVGFGLVAGLLSEACGSGGTGFGFGFGGGGRRNGSFGAVPGGGGTGRASGTM
jgi:hypothetical protein